MNLEQALKRIEELENEVEKTNLDFEKEKDRLIRLIRSWKRKSEEKGIIREFMREGYNANSGMHYKMYSINLPCDLPIEQVLDYFKEKILPDLYPYTFKKIDYVPRKKEWAFEVEMYLGYDIQLEVEFLQRYYENNPY